MRVMLNDGAVMNTHTQQSNVVFLSSFRESIGMVQSMGASNSALNAVKEPAELIAHILGLGGAPIRTRNAISGAVDHAPLPMSIVVRKMEEAYAAHLSDYAACDCPAVYKLQFVSALRNASYNWLGFMWQPGEGQNAHQIENPMCCSGESATL